MHKLYLRMIYDLKNADKILTFEEILNKYSEYTLYSMYIGQFKLHTPINSPLREDKNPSFSIFPSRKTGNLIWHDFKTGESGGLWKFLKDFLHLKSYKEVLLTLSKDLPLMKDFKAVRTPVYRNKDVTIQVSRKPFSKKELEYWGKYFIVESTLKLFKVDSISKYYSNNVISMTSSVDDPMFCYKVFNHFKIYRPITKNKKDKWRSNLHPYDIMGYEQLPPSGDILIITKSLKDVMVLYECGYSAISPQSESQLLPVKVMEELKNRFAKIYVLYDNDAAGIEYSSKMSDLYNLIPIFLDEQKDISDYADFIKDKSKVAQKIKEMVNEM